MAPHHLRRADREIARDEALAVFDDALFATVATVDEDGFPYGVPLSLARKGSTLYFHSTNEGGHKAGSFRRDGRACVTAVVDVEAFFADNDFSTSYRSAIAYGHMREVSDPVEFKHALVDLCMKYVPSEKREIGKAMQLSGPRASVWALDIEELTGKANVH